MRTWLLISMLLGVGLTGCAAPAAPGAAKPAPAGREAAMATVDFRSIVQSAKEKVFPAVVYIRVVQENMDSGRKVSVTGAGSGVIIAGSGEVLTNWHVIDKATEIRCLLYDGRAMNGKVIGSDKDADLALVQLELPKGKEPPLPTAVLGESTGLKEGDFVMAMGAPWGLNRSVSIGIISCTRRFLPGTSEYSLWLQTDAQISPGNSGGPLVNTDGQIVGINTRGNGDQGFTIPADTIRRVLPQLRKGNVDWSWTGLQLQCLKDFNRNMYFDGSDGCIVSETDPDSPAWRAGIQPQDRLLKVNGQSTTALREEDLPEVRRTLGFLPKGEVAKLEILRGAQTLNIELTPRVKGRVEGEELDCPRWDLTVKAINQFDNPDLYNYVKAGVFILATKSPGNASNSGLTAQDIVVKVQDQEVKTLDDVKKIHADAIKNIDKKPKLVFTVMRDGLTRQVVLDFSRDYERR